MNKWSWCLIWSKERNITTNKAIHYFERTCSSLAVLLFLSLSLPVLNLLQHKPRISGTFEQNVKKIFYFSFETETKEEEKKLSKNCYNRKWTGVANALKQTRDREINRQFQFFLSLFLIYYLIYFLRGFFIFCDYNLYFIHAFVFWKCSTN